MENRLYYALKLADELNVDITSKDWPAKQVLGNYFKVLSRAFKNKESHFSFKLINKEYLITNMFKGEKYKIGTGNTMAYVQTALEMLSIKSPTKYSEEDMVNKGWDLNEIQNYDSLDDYLYSDKIFKQLTSKRFENYIRTAIYHFLILDNNSEGFLKKNIRTFSPNSLSDFKNSFDSLYIAVFKEKTPYYGIHPKTKNLMEISSSVKEMTNDLISENMNELNILKEEVKNSKGPAKIKYLIGQSATISSLRRIHREGIRKQLISYKKQMNIIDDYAFCFDLDKKVGKIAEAAHIIGVQELVLDGRFSDISNPNNGLLLDPNTHKNFDGNKLMFSTGFEQLLPIENEPGLDILFNIPNFFLNDERKTYIKEWIKS